MFFDGKVGKSRVITQRGNANVKSSRDLLADAQKLREKRAQDAKRARQVTLLQRVSRRFLAERYVSRRCLASLEEDLSQAMTEREISLRALNSLLLRCSLSHATDTRYVLYAQRVQHTGTRALTLLAQRDRVLSATQRLLTTRLAQCVSDAEIERDTVWRVSALLRLSLRTLRESLTTRETERESDAAFVCALLSPLCASQREYSRSTHTALLSEVVLREATELVVVLRECVICAAHSALVGVLCDVLQSVWEKESRSAKPELRERLTAELIRQLLTIPSVANVDALTSLTQSLFTLCDLSVWERVFSQHLHTLTRGSERETERDRVFFLENFLSLSESHMPSALRESVVYERCVVSGLHTALAHNESARLFLLSAQREDEFPVLCEDERERAKALLVERESERERDRQTDMDIVDESVSPPHNARTQRLLSTVVVSPLSEEQGERVLSQHCEALAALCGERVSLAARADSLSAERERRLDFRAAVVQHGVSLSQHVLRLSATHHTTRAHNAAAAVIEEDIERDREREQRALLNVVYAVRREHSLPRLLATATQRSLTTMSKSCVTPSTESVAVITPFTTQPPLITPSTTHTPAQSGALSDALSAVRVTAALLSLSPTMLSPTHAPLRQSSQRTALLQHLSFSPATQRALTTPSHYDSDSTSLTTPSYNAGSLWRLLCAAFPSPSLTLFTQLPTEAFLSHTTTLSLSLSLSLSPREALHTLLCALAVWSAVLTHTLQAIDDDELLSEQRVLSVAELAQSAALLSALTQRFFCVEPLCGPRAVSAEWFLSLSTEDFSQRGLTTALSSDGLLSLYCVTQCTALFNALCARNERRRFLSPSQFEWAHLTTQDTALSEGNDDNSEKQDVDSVDIAVKSGSIKMVLGMAPQVVPLKLRVRLFHALVLRDKENYSPEARMFHSPPMHYTLRRDHLITDALTQLHTLPAHLLKGSVRVSFISEHGHAEAGIDGGGLFKEFVDSLAGTVCKPSFGMFALTSEQQLCPAPLPQPTLFETERVLFEFLGKIVGKALYERIFFESEFSPTFLNALLGHANQFDDLVHLDAALLRSLRNLKRSANSGEDVEALGLCFEYSREVVVGETRRVVNEEIKPRGQSVPVTNANLREYAILLANHVQNVLIRPQCRAFLQGLQALIPRQWLRMFNAHELQLLIGGERRKIDVEDMKTNAVLHGYATDEPYIASFWRIVDEMDVQDQSELLKFVTACPRQPLLGFASLSPRLGIQCVSAHEGVEGVESEREGVEEREGERAAAIGRLPSAATCMNLLKLPRYRSEEVLRDKLLYAIRSKSGFELS